MAQPVEVEIRAARHGDEGLALEIVARDVLAHARDRERPGRFRDRARVLEQVLDRRTDLVGVHEDDLIDVLARELETLLPDALHRDAVREDADTLERDALVR